MNPLGNYIDPNVAFNKAIADGRLSDDQDQAHYAGNYMYMHTDENGKDLFKNINTRQYDI